MIAPIPKIVLLLVMLMISSMGFAQERDEFCFYDTVCFVVHQKFDTLYSDGTSGNVQNAYLNIKWQHKYEKFTAMHQESSCQIVENLLVSEIFSFQNLGEYVNPDCCGHQLDSVVKSMPELSVASIIEVKDCQLKLPWMKNQNTSLHFEELGYLIFLIVGAEKEVRIYYSQRARSELADIAVIDHWLKTNKY